MKNVSGFPPWKPAPLLRYLIPLMMGIVVSDHVSLNPIYIFILLLVLYITGILFVQLNAVVLLGFGRFPGIVFQLILFCLGLALHKVNDIRRHHNWYGHAYSDSSILVATIVEPPLKRLRSVKAPAIITNMKKGSATSITKGRIIIYFSSDTHTILPSLNDRIIFKKRLAFIRNSGNPGEFDYRTFAARQQLFHQVYLKKNDYIIVEKRPGNLDTYLFSARDKILSILKKHFTDPEILGIAEALLIGYKNDLDNELLQAYSQTGIVHIIAISGLHLGLIFWMLNFLCNLVPLIKRSSWLKFTVIVSCLWIFALITGASASVLRSALMFSFIVAGKEFFRSASVYNSISCSAFILLCYDTKMLWDAGFQLSYLAVIGIVWLQRSIGRSLFISNYLLKQLWAMASVTIAAQIMAFPICLFYFHQFPNLFLLANMVEVPVSTIVLFAEILLILFCWLGPLADLIATSIEYLVGFMNFFAKKLSGLPFASLENIRATVFSTLLLYLLIIFTVLFIKKRSTHSLHRILIVSLAWIGCFVWSDISVARKTQVVIYNLPGVPYIETRKGRQYSGLSISKAIPPTRLLQQSHLYLGMKDSFIMADKYDHLNQIFRVGNLKLAWLSKRPVMDELPKELDILILSGNLTIDLKELYRFSRPSMIVIDHSNSLWKIEKWKTECEDLILPCHFTTELGAFITDFAATH